MLCRLACCLHVCSWGHILVDSFCICGNPPGENLIAWESTKLVSRVQYGIVFERVACIGRFGTIGSSVDQSCNNMWMSVGAVCVLACFFDAYLSADPRFVLTCFACLL